ncbi:MAG: protein-disulfide reductase DsbD domain-containing protein [Pseudomonadota bacterium]
MSNNARTPERRRSRVTLLLTGLLLSGLVAAQGLPGSGSSLFAEPKFLPVDAAFSFYTSQPEPGVVVVHWDIAEGYYLYREKFGFTVRSTTDTPEKLDAELPVGIAHHDEFFGDVEVYYDQVEARVSPETADKPVILVIEYQGCSEQGLCYPPQEREIELTL